MKKFLMTVVTRCYLKLKNLFHSSPKKQTKQVEPSPAKSSDPSTVIAIKAYLKENDGSNIMTINQAKDKAKKVDKLLYRECLREDYNTGLVKDLSAERIYLKKIVEYAEKVAKKLPENERN